MKKIFFCLFACFFVSAGEASIINLSTTDNGSYRGGSGYHHPNNNSILTGTTNGFTYRSFYNFDVSSLAGLDMISAEIVFAHENGFYNSADQTEQINIFDVHSRFVGLATSLSTFNDLGSGALYGQANVSGVFHDPMPEVRVLLLESSFSDILANGFFSVGATCETCLLHQNLWFNSYLGVAATLQINYLEKGTIPEPPVLALIGLGLLGLAKTRRKQA